MSKLDCDVSSERFLRDKYAIVGVGETSFTRGSGKTTRQMAVAAVRRAMEDAGLAPSDVDGIVSYQINDSTPGNIVASDLGIRPNFYMDMFGGGSSSETLIGLSIGAIEAGMCETVAIFRSMNGYSSLRMGGTGHSNAPVVGDMIHNMAYGFHSAAQRYAPSFMRHMHEYGTTSEQAAMVKVHHSRHAACNPKALYPKVVTVDEVLASRMISSPLHLLDCCVETDNANCIVVTKASRAKDLRQHPVLIRAVIGRVSTPRTDMPHQYGLTSSAAVFGRDRLWSNAGLGPEEVDVTGSYDAFTFTNLLLFEDYGFCAKGEGGTYVSDGTTSLGGRRPSNTSGGHLCEGYSHGLSMIIENVRQLRGDVDDFCPVVDGVRHHTHDHTAGCRQVRDAEVAANLGWANLATGSALVTARA